MGKRPKKTIVEAIAEAQVELSAAEVQSAEAGPPDSGSVNEIDPAKVLAELRQMNEWAQAAHGIYEDLKAQTKGAKEEYETLAKAVLDRLTAATTPPSLPLFDQVQREADQQRMEAASAVELIPDDSIPF